MSDLQTPASLKADSRATRGYPVSPRVDTLTVPSSVAAASASTHSEPPISPPASASPALPPTAPLACEPLETSPPPATATPVAVPSDHPPQFSISTPHTLPKPQPPTLTKPPPPLPEVPLERLVGPQPTPAKKPPVGPQPPAAKEPPPRLPAPGTAGIQKHPPRRFCAHTQTQHLHREQCVIAASCEVARNIYVPQSCQVVMSTLLYGFTG